MSLDVACDVPVAFAKELLSVIGKEEQKWTWSEQQESLLRSEGERGVEAVGGAHMTRAGLRGQQRWLQYELTHLIYPRRSQRHRRHHRILHRGRPPDTAERSMKGHNGMNAEDVSG